MYSPRVSQETIELLTGPAFLTGILAGGTAVVIGWLAYLLFNEGDRPSRTGGIVLTVAALTAITVVEEIPSIVVVGIALLAIAGWMPLPSIFSPLLALPGALLIAFDGGIPSADWLPWFITIAIALAAPLVASFDRAYAPTGLPFPTYALAVVGLFFTVPDTEIAVVLLGAVLAGTLLGWPKPLFAMGRGGAFALVGSFVWVAGTGGAARPVTVIVAVACLGLLLAEPVGRWLSQPLGTVLSSRTIDPIVVLVAQFAIVFLLSRVVTHIAGAWATAAAAGAVLGVAALAVAFATRTPEHLSERASP
jgi:hypothetical protein